MKGTRRVAPKRRILSAIAAGAILSGSLVACAPGGAGGTADKGASASDIEAALKKGGELTYWTWTPQAEAQVAAFEKAYPKVDIKLVNAGTGNDQYTKLQNAIKAGSGAPDVVQIEYFALPQFALAESLVDLSSFGFDELESDYTASTWGSVNIGGGLYGLPQDSGPMAMFYNKTVFDEAGVEIPQTWDEYLEAARAIRASDPKKSIAADTGDAGFTTSMIWQAGGAPFTTDGTNVTIDLQNEGSKKWADTWNTLLQEDLFSTVPGWSEEWYKALGDGSIATLTVGAWMPGILESSVPDAAGDWRVAPLPTYDGKPATAENGGGGQSIPKQSKNQALAAGFLKWLNNGDGVKTFIEKGGFPSTTSDLESEEFTGYESDYFGGQKINEVLAASAGEVVTGWSYLPFQVYANSIFGDTVGKVYAEKGDINEGLAKWQEALVKYGNEQGFTVNG